jgi:hypothetical protein
VLAPRNGGCVRDLIPSTAAGGPRATPATAVRSGHYSIVASMCGLTARFHDIHEAMYVRMT